MLVGNPIFLNQAPPSYSLPSYPPSYPLPSYPLPSYSRPLLETCGAFTCSGYSDIVLAPLQIENPTLLWILDD